MRFYFGLTLAFMGPLVSLLCLPWLWNYGLTACVVLAGVLVAFALLTDWDQRRRRVRGSYGLATPDGEITVALDDVDGDPGARHSVPRAIARILVTDLGGIGAGLAFLLGASVFLLLLASTPFIARAGWDSPLLTSVRSSPSPVAVAYDGAGNLYVLDSANGQVERLPANGSAEATWSSAGTRPGQLSGRGGIAAAADRVYVADRDNDRVEVFSPSGSLLDDWGDAGKDLSVFSLPDAVAAGPRARVYVADAGDRRVVELTEDGAIVQRFPTARSPVGITVATDGTAYVLDARGAVTAYSPDGHKERSWMSDAVRPEAITSDRWGSLFIVDSLGGVIRVFTTSGRPIAHFAAGGTTSANVTAGIAAAPDGTLAVAEARSHRVIRLGPYGTVLGRFVAHGYALMPEQHSRINPPRQERPPVAWLKALF